MHSKITPAPLILRHTWIIGVFFWKIPVPPPKWQQPPPFGRQDEHHLWCHLWRGGGGGGWWIRCWWSYYYFTLVILLQYNLFYISSGLKYKKSIHLLLRHAAAIYIFLFLAYCCVAPSSSAFEEQLVSKFSNGDKKVALHDAFLCVYDASWLLLLMVTKRTQNWSDLLNHPRPFWYVNLFCCCMFF